MTRHFARRVFLLCFAAASLLHAETKSPWLGVWAAKLGDYGVVAFSIGDKGDGVPARVECWWLVDTPRIATMRIDGDTLFIDVLNHQRTAVPGLALKITDRQTLRFADYGVLPVPLDSLYADAEFTRPTDDNPWYRITNTYYKTSEWGKWHESGQLKPLPDDWPSSVASPLLRFFAYDDHLFHRAVILPSLSEEELNTAYAWTHDKNIWSNGPDFVRQCIGRNPHAPLGILAALWNHPDNSQFWITAAQHPRAPAEWRTSLVDRILSGSDNVQSRAIWTGDAPPELYLRLIQEKPALRTRIAVTRDMPALVYERLARDYAQESLASLITNPSVPAALLETIAASADRNLQLSLINNPTLPAATRSHLVHKILEDATPGDFARFVHDRDATPKFLTRCSGDLDPGIRTYVAQNANTAEPLLLTLAEDPSRPVAEAARSALQSRFPATFAHWQSTFTPLASRAEDVPLHQRFADAIAVSDLPAIRRLAGYQAERGQLDSILFQNARHVIRDAFRPAVMDLFLELGFARDRGELAPLAGQCGGNSEWLAYFKAHDAFAKSSAARAYQAALESKDLVSLAGLLTAGVDPNQPGEYGRTPLHLAILGNNLPAAEALLKHGADPSVRDGQRRTPLDYAVALKSNAAIRLLDTKGEYAASVAAFAKEFPPAPTSKFLGNWTNNRDGFNTVAIVLNPDGSGRFGGGVMGGLLAWRETSAKEAIAYILGETGEPIRSAPVKLQLDDEGKALTFAPSKGEAQRMTHTER
jgi:hypothetical protein